MITADDTRPIVFLGPSLPLAEARRILDADYRPPIKRGDLPGLDLGRKILIVDGEFDQSLSVSPKEILRLLDGGSFVSGASSMGALRAAELAPMGMIGIGRIFEGYRTGRIEGDDEVALKYCPFKLRALTVPQVNVRFWLEDLEVAKLIDAQERGLLLRRSRRIYYADRTPDRLAQAVLDALGAARLDLIRGRGFGKVSDVKAEDAREALASVARLVPGGPPA
jgi:hypothetical protein